MKNIVAIATTLLALSCAVQDSWSTSPVVSIASGNAASNDELQLRVSESIISLMSNGDPDHPVRNSRFTIIESIRWVFHQQTGELITVQQQSKYNGGESYVCWLYQVEGADLIALQSDPFCQWKPSAKLESRNGESWLRIPVSIRQVADSPVGDGSIVVLFSNKTKEACLYYRISSNGLGLCSPDEINRMY